MAEAEKVRLDKWLWAARFFKTRKIAAEAISGGKVHLNGQRTKPGKEVQPGTKLTIHKGSLSWDIEVSVSAHQRRPASEAKDFYIESEQSAQARHEQTALLREQRAQEPRIRGKMNKKDRRLIHRFTGKGQS